jgi:hypothetical protein
MQLTVFWDGDPGIVTQRDAGRRAQATETVAVPDPSELAIRYHRSGNVLWAVETALSLLIPAVLLFTGFSARIRTLAQRIGRRWFMVVALYALIFTLVTALLTLPVAYYDGFLRQHAYGLSNQSLGRWLSEWLKGVAVSGIGVSLVLWIPYLLLKKSPRLWWLYAGLATIPIATLVLVLTTGVRVSRSLPQSITPGPGSMGWLMSGYSLPSPTGITVCELQPLVRNLFAILSGH